MLRLRMLVSSANSMTLTIVYHAVIVVLWSAPSSAGPTSWGERPCPSAVLSTHVYACPVEKGRTAPLLVISLDGLRADYLDRSDLNLSVLHRIRDCGTHAPSMSPVYPPVTYASHYTMATGLFAESHGIIDNKFTDQRTGAQFSYKDKKSKLNSSWWLGEPIWVTAQKQGKRVNVHSWIGAEVEIKGIRPNEYYGYNNTAYPIEQRIDTILQWLSRPDDTRPDLSMLYLEEPDAAGHKTGPSSQGLRKAIARVNQALDRLMQGLFDRNILYCTNIIIVSDHGMSAHKCPQTVKISPIVHQSQALRNLNFSDDNYNLLETWTMARISVNNTNATVDQVFDALNCPSNSRKPSKYQLYRRETQPRRFHYFNEERIEPIVLTLTPPYTVFKEERADNFCEGGEHGYDNLYPSQQGIFLAQGPSFNGGQKTAAFSNIELYNLMADLLLVKPAPNNGTCGALHHILKSPPPATADVDTLYATALAADFPLGSSNKDRTSEEARMRGNGREAVLYGLPLALKALGDVTAVYSQHVVSGYSASTTTTLWTAFHLSDTEVASGPSTPAGKEGRRHGQDQGSTATDTRKQSSTRRPNYDKYTKLQVEAVYLHHPALSDSADYHGRNSHDALGGIAVPMYKAFRNGVWKIFWRMLDEWKRRQWTLHVVLGPVFDDASPLGLVDLPEETSEGAEKARLRIPSHFFAVITKTDPQTFADDELPATLAFILPHDVKQRSACQDNMSYILTHSATVVDVELITGLRFFPNLQLRESVKLRTSLPEKLWHEDMGLERLETID